MSVIAVEGIKLYCYHGCLKEEAAIGANYIVDVYLKADLSKSCKTDNLSDTIDYVTVYNVVKEQMAIRSNLIEHCARRIMDVLKSLFNAEITVKVTKINPPMNGDVERVFFTLIE